MRIREVNIRCKGFGLDLSNLKLCIDDDKKKAAKYKKNFSIPGTVSEAAEVLHSDLLSVESLLPLEKCLSITSRESKSYIVGYHKSNHGSVTDSFLPQLLKSTLSSVTKLEAISILKVINKRKAKSMASAPTLDT